jgi:hypothetical protein
MVSATAEKNAASVAVRVRSASSFDACDAAAGVGLGSCAPAGGQASRHRRSCAHEEIASRDRKLVVARMVLAHKITPCARRGTFASGIIRCLEQD